MTNAPAASRPRNRDTGLPLLAVLFVAACVTLPLLRHLYLPLVDLPNHIARLHIAATAGAGPLAEYYTYSAKPVPNSAVDLLWIGLGHPLDPAHFANLVMASYAANMVFATCVLARVVHGRWTLWPAAVGLVVYNQSFFWGFQNFVWSLPFSLYALALWLLLEQRGLLLRVAVFVPIAAMTYFMHFFVFAFLAVLVFGRELQTLIEMREARLRGLLARVALALPFLLPVAWLVLTLSSGDPSPQGSHTSFGTLFGRVRRFALMLEAPIWTHVSVLNTLGTIGTFVLAASFASLARRSGTRLVLNARLRGPVIALFLVALSAPDWLNGVALVDIRAPALVVAVLFAGTTWQDLDRRQAVVLAAIFGVLIAARGLAFERFAASYEADVADMFATTETLPAGARVLPLRGPGKEADPVLFHLQGLLVGAHEVFVPTLFQGVHALQLRKGWESHAHPAYLAIDIRRVLDPRFSPQGPIFAQDWNLKFTHALLMDRTDPIRDPRLHPVAQTGRFTLFEIRPEGAASE